jgi:ATP-dependent RNA helicase DDX46/PRP5
VVINYACPNHLEDYVHRVGRTGRAGNKGTAYTFITPDQDRYAMDICKALKMSNQQIPADLQELADSFQNKVKEGSERASGSGFGGKGLERLDNDRDFVKKLQKKAYGGEEDSDDEDFEQLATKAVESAISTPTAPSAKVNSNSKEEAVLSGAALAAKVAARLSQKAVATAITSDNDVRHVFSEEIVINDYPQNARWKVTNKDQINSISENSGAAITTRGTFFPPGKQPKPNERKLYLFIEGDSEMVVENAKNEIKRILIEATAAQMEQDARGGGRYQV